MRDLIDKLSVCEILADIYPTDGEKVVGVERIDKAYEAVLTLPSAQPEQAVKGCRNCKYGKYNDHWKTNFCYNPNNCTEWNLWEPSAQPERKTGHWIEIALSNHSYKCSVCGRLLVNITDGKDNVTKNYPYCHCGADMRGEKDDEQASTNND